MPKLTKKAIRSRRTDGRTDPNYGKATLLKRKTTSIRVKLNKTVSKSNASLLTRIPTFFSRIKTFNTF